MSLGDDHGYGGAPGGRTSEDFGGSGQTRTRLPGNTDTDIYGGARRTGRGSSRSLVAVVGVVVLLIAAIAFANQGGGGTDDGASGEAGGKGPSAQPTAASGVRPVKGNEGGIPTGYARDEQGAQSAAANYAVALVSADILKPDRRREIVHQLFLPEKVSELQANLDQAYDQPFLDKLGLDANGNAAPGMTYVSRTSPVGTKVTAYSSASATVEVWCTGVFGTAGVSSTNPVTNDWFTMTLKLRWTEADWKVESFSQKDGPAPVNADRTASNADEIAKAVEQYGGFTYAR
ncbi:hypothetical protein ACIQ7Q_17595 [Streptomyces sp. NPDC096176]|uniref:hypothetical protein n=1 Tax=Streptomyces sp. NPDC096176 TaxID=3366079 RepID=UPI003827443A